MFKKINEPNFNRQKKSHENLSSSSSSDYPMMNADNCQHLKRQCPLHLFDISPYTDL